MSPKANRWWIFIRTFWFFVMENKYVSMIHVYLQKSGRRFNNDLKSRINK